MIYTSPHNLNAKAWTHNFVIVDTTFSVLHLSQINIVVHAVSEEATEKASKGKRNHSIFNRHFFLALISICNYKSVDLHK